MMNDVTIMNAIGMEETAPSTGSSLGLTAPPLFLAGLSSRMGFVIRSAITPDASLMALNARNLHPPASMWFSTWLLQVYLNMF